LPNRWRMNRTCVVPPRQPAVALLRVIFIVYGMFNILKPEMYPNNIYDLFLFFSWGETESTLYCCHCWPIVPAPDGRWWRLWSIRWNANWRGKPKYSEKTCPSVTLSTTNPIWPDSGSNPGLRGGKPAINRLSYAAANNIYNFSSYITENILLLHYKELGVNYI
jgi:hypothetical protein